MNVFSKHLNLRAWSAQEVRDAKRTTQQYEVTEEFWYVSDEYATIIVPRGFVTDFASIPRPVWSILDPEDPVILFPSVVHDWLYSERGAMRYTRLEADRILREGMEACGALGWQRHLVYQAVRKFGGGRWPQDAQGQKIEA